MAFYEVHLLSEILKFYGRVMGIFYMNMLQAPVLFRGIGHTINPSNSLVSNAFLTSKC